jgi:hypothetical protein
MITPFLIEFTIKFDRAGSISTERDIAPSFPHNTWDIIVYFLWKEFEYCHGK